MREVGKSEKKLMALSTSVMYLQDKLEFMVYILIALMNLYILLRVFLM
jgi:hypothetical protein